ncbi:MAG: radical SAM/SPASM domain-containing protein [Magnetococcales bacterium]|nr:radical SAM/SPASM domain-containing protein [Magnetococcales bacterium]
MNNPASSPANSGDTPRYPVTELTHVELQLASWCNRSCSFCPSGKYPVAKALMSLETVERILVGLEKIAFTGTVGLHLMCEPFLNKQIVEIIRRFRTRLPQTFIRLETNGEPIKNMKKLGEAFDAGLNEALINCYGSPEQFRNRADQLLELNKSRKNMWFFNQYQDWPPGPPSTWEVVRLRAFHSDDYDLSSWAGLVERPNKPELPLPLSCNRPFRNLHINYLGQAVLCSMDWKYEVVFGDVMRQDVEGILNAPLMVAYRNNLTVKNRCMPVCERCDKGMPVARKPGYPPVDPWTIPRKYWIRAKRLYWSVINGLGK